MLLLMPMLPIAAQLVLVLVSQLAVIDELAIGLGRLHLQLLRVLLLLLML